MTAEVSTFHPLGDATVEDWLAAEQPSDGSRLELGLGYLYMTPPPTGSHQYATGELFVALRSAVRAAGRSDLQVLPGVGVKISTAFRTAVIPDVAVVAADAHRTAFESHELVLAVEVWSPGNSRDERNTKIAGYAAARVPYLWIVELPDDKPAKFCGYRLAESGYRQEVHVTEGETVLPPSPVPVEVATALLR